jgi:hypothetical protein
VVFGRKKRKNIRETTQMGRRGQGKVEKTGKARACSRALRAGKGGRGEKRGVVVVFSFKGTTQQVDEKKKKRLF